MGEQRDLTPLLLSPEEVADVLRVGGPGSTNVYGHVAIDDQRAALSKLDGLLDG